MEDPSSPLARLTSISSTVSHRAAHLSQATFNAKVWGTREEYLVESIASFLHQLHEHVTKLESRLSSGTAVLSARVQRVLDISLHACDGLMEKMHAQFSLLRPDACVDLEWTFLVLHLRCVVRYVRLVRYIVDLLLLNTPPAEQDANLDSKAGRRLLEQVESASSIVADSSHLLQQDPISSDASNSRRPHVRNEPVKLLFDQPPSYSSPEPPSPKRPPTQISSNGGPGAGTTAESTKRLSSLKNSFKALASGLRSKPEPFVSALCQAASIGDDQQVAGLISQGANVNGRNENGDTAYKCAVVGDQTGPLVLLSNARAHCKMSDYTGLPPFFYAASIGSFKVARFLLDGQATVHDVNSSGRTYFSVVAHRGSAAGVQFLLENGARVDAVEESGQPVLLAAVKRGDVKVVELLLQHGAKISFEHSLDCPLLITAIDTGSYELVELLIKHGASVTRIPSTKTTLVSYALTKKRADIMKLLLMYGASSMHEHDAVQPLLVKVVRDIDIDNDDKWDIVQLMLEGGSNPEDVDQTLKVPVIGYAVEMCSAEVVLELLRFGANPNGRVASGLTMLWYAVDRRRPDTVKVLLEYGANPNANTGEKNTLLTHTLLKQEHAMAKLLVEYGADMDAEGSEVGLIFSGPKGQRRFLEELRRVRGTRRVNPHARFAPVP